MAPEWLRDKWRSYQIKKLGRTIGEILNSYQCFELSFDESRTNYIHYEDSILQMSVKYSSDFYNLWIMLVVVFKEQMKKVEWTPNKISFTDKDNNIPKDYRFTIEIDNIKDVLDSKDSYILLPCKEKYKELAIDASKTAKVCPQFMPFDLDSKCKNLMISPFTGDKKGKNIDVSDAFVDFVLQNLLDKQKIKKEKIRELYRGFIQEYGQDVS